MRSALAVAVRWRSCASHRVHHAQTIKNSRTAPTAIANTHRQGHRHTAATAGCAAAAAVPAPGCSACTGAHSTAATQPVSHAGVTPLLCGITRHCTGSSITVEPFAHRSLHQASAPPAPTIVNQAFQIESQLHRSDTQNTHSDSCMRLDLDCCWRLDGGLDLDRSSTDNTKIAGQAGSKGQHTQRHTQPQFSRDRCSFALAVLCG